MGIIICFLELNNSIAKRVMRILTKEVADDLASIRDSQRYNLRSLTRDKHIYAVMSMKEATTVYGNSAVHDAGFTELRNCIDKEVRECIPPNEKIYRPTPFKLFLTPKTSPTGEFKLLKG